MTQGKYTVLQEELEKFDATVVGLDADEQLDSRQRNRLIGHALPETADKTWFYNNHADWKGREAFVTALRQRFVKGSIFFQNAEQFLGFEPQRRDEQLSSFVARYKQAVRRLMMSRDGETVLENDRMTGSTTSPRTGPPHWRSSLTRNVAYFFMTVLENDRTTGSMTS